MIKQSIVIAAAMVAVGAAAAANAADIAAGAAIVKHICSACHVPSNWKGKSPAQIDALIHKVVARKVMHPRKLKLTDAQMADVAAYWASVANK